MSSILIGTSKEYLVVGYVNHQPPPMWIAQSRHRLGFESALSRFKSDGIFFLFGLACTKAGDVPLQGMCGEFDSLRVHNLICSCSSAGGSI